MSTHSILRPLGVAALALALLAPPAQAEEPAAEQSAARKLGRGVAAIVYGFLEVPGNMIQESRDHGPLYGLTVGGALGAGKLVARTLVGVYEVVTAPFALPAGFEPILEPEFAWEYFDAGPGEYYGLRKTYLASEERAIAAIPGAAVDRRAGALRVQFPSDLLFPLGSSELSAGAKRRLAKLAGVLKQNPDARLFVKGFTDTTGPEAFNQDLSRRRAQAVRAYLAARGISGSRIEAEGFGSARPVASNDTPAGRRSNRRVEIEVRAGAVAGLR